MIETFYDIVYILPISLSLLLIPGPLMGIDTPTKAVYLVTVLASIYFCLLRHTTMRFRIGSIGVLMIGLGGLAFFKKADERALFVQENRWFFMVVLFAFASFLLMVLVTAFHRLRLLVGGLLVGFAATALFMHMEIPKTAAVSLYFLLLLILAEEVQRRWKKSGFTDAKKHLVYIMPFLLVAVVVMTIFPVSRDPYDWAFAKNVYEKAKDQVSMLTQNITIGRSVNYETADIGFSDYGQISAELKDKQTIVMEAEDAPKGVKTYLAGKVFDRFDGKQWFSDNPYADDSRMLDTMETIGSANTYAGERAGDYYKAVDLKITYQSLKSTNMFAPMKSVTKEKNLEAEKLSFRGDTILFPKKKGYNTSYELKYYRFNTGKDLYEEWMKSGISMTPEIWENIRTRFDLSKVKGFSYDDFLRYRENLNWFYLTPVELSPEVREMVDPLMKEETTTYGKLLKLEVLFADFSYNTNPGSLPGQISTDAAFLDYFLLDHPEGYCSHFATAFVLLARAYGIPARYVQGYYFYGNGNEIAQVTADRAHAWPEAYIEGIGWVPFEPTPGFKRVYEWKTTAERQDEKAAAMAEVSFGEKEDAEEEEENEEILEEKPINTVSLGRIAVVLLSCVLFIIFVLTVERLLLMRWLKKLDPERKYRVLCARNMKILSMLSFCREDSETLTEFSNRVDSELGMDVTAFVPALESLLYGEKQVEDDAYKLAETNNEQLLKLLKKQKGIWFPIYYYRSVGTKGEWK